MPGVAVRCEMRTGSNTVRGMVHPAAINLYSGARIVCRHSGKKPNRAFRQFAQIDLDNEKYGINPKVRRPWRRLPGLLVRLVPVHSLKEVKEGTPVPTPIVLKNAEPSMENGLQCFLGGRDPDTHLEAGSLSVETR